MSTTYRALITRLSRVAGEAGLNRNDDRLKDIFNTVSEMLFSEGQMPWNYAIVNLSVFDDRVVLPPYFDSVAGVAHDFQPILLANRWYEFSHSGPGPQLAEACHKWANTLIDRGFSPIARQPAEGTAFPLRVRTQVDEAVGGVLPTMLILGFDENGDWVRSLEDGVWADGVKIELDASAEHTQTAISFSRVHSIVKPITRGKLTLSWYDSTLDVELAAGELLHDTEVSSFRVYSLPAATVAVENQLQLLVHTRFRPVVNDDDVPQIDCFPALRYGFMAYAKEESGDVDAAVKWWTMARSELGKLLQQTSPVIHTGTVEVVDAGATSRQI